MSGFTGIVNTPWGHGFFIIGYQSLFYCRFVYVTNKWMRRQWKPSDLLPRYLHCNTFLCDVWCPELVCCSSELRNLSVQLRSLYYYSASPWVQSLFSGNERRKRKSHLTTDTHSGPLYTRTTKYQIDTLISFYSGSGNTEYLKPASQLELSNTVSVWTASAYNFSLPIFFKRNFTNRNKIVFSVWKIHYQAAS